MEEGRDWSCKKLWVGWGGVGLGFGIGIGKVEDEDILGFMEV